MGVLAASIALVLTFFAAQLIHLSLLSRWTEEQTRFGRYFCATPYQRERLRRRLRRHQWLLWPTLFLLSRAGPIEFERLTFRHRGVAGPKGSCSPETFEKAAAYRPTEQDLFVVTQLRCGTTWMQQLVYQVLVRGQEELAASGRTLGCVSPWIESVWTRPPEEAPLVGLVPAFRILKTHLPADLCPFSPEARYVYVTRHPLDCFASCLDYLSANLGPFRFRLEEATRWFCSREWMWWTPWPDHVAGWLRRAQSSPNILFVTYEQMHQDLEAVIDRVARFLQIEPLRPTEIRPIVAHCSFSYMQQHEEAFEMAPPHVLRDMGGLFVRGHTGRYKHLPPPIVETILSFCRKALADYGVSLASYYPDLAA
jgi:hypothetical protein